MRYVFTHSFVRNQLILMGINLHSGLGIRVLLWLARLVAMRVLAMSFGWALDWKAVASCLEHVWS